MTHFHFINKKKVLKTEKIHVIYRGTQVLLTSYLDGSIFHTKTIQKSQESNILKPLKEKKKTCQPIILYPKETIFFKTIIPNEESQTSLSNKKGVYVYACMILFI